MFVDMNTKFRLLHLLVIFSPLDYLESFFLFNFDIVFKQFFALLFYPIFFFFYHNELFGD